MPRVADMLLVGSTGHTKSSSSSSVESFLFRRSAKAKRYHSLLPTLEQNNSSREHFASSQLIATQDDASDTDDDTLRPRLRVRAASQPDVPRRTPKPRPKHVPIVIPRCAQPFGPTGAAPVTPTSITGSDSSPTRLEFPIPPRKSSIPPPVSFPSPDLSPSGKPRHVEIKIPSWACPIRIPDSPESIPSPFLRSFRSASSSSDRRSPSPREMARVTPGNSRSNTLDSTIPEPSGLYGPNSNAGGNMYAGAGVNGSQTNLYRLNTQDLAADREGQSRTPASGYQMNPSPAMPSIAGVSSGSSNSGLSGLVCNVHRTTGREPRPLVGASTTILGDKLYVFGGRKLSRARPQLTNDLYELDLIKRHWTKLETTGDKPPVRYFHSVCALGDTKLVLFGGMSPAILPNGQPAVPDQPVNPQDSQPEVVALSDIHIYDVPTRSWMKINAINPPQGRYAHCAAVLPSSSVFSSPNAANAAIHHNVSSPSAPNSGTLGVTLDGDGGAELIVVGGQDTANHYIEQINVFNLRSLTWTTAQPFSRSCGAYRSVTAPLNASAAAKLGVSTAEARQSADRGEEPTDGSSALLIYSNYNFLDVRLELQVRKADGTLIEKEMLQTPSPPGLRFPNGGIIDDHFVVSGTFLTSSKQEYALWALDLRKLTWSRIDAGATTFSQGSWNRGVLWNRRNTFVILGNRKRSLVEDYNHRRINFTNICMVELEAFGLYDNPRKKAPSSGYISASAKAYDQFADGHAGGRPLSKAAEDLGLMALQLTEFGDMDFVSMNGDRIPANSHIVSRRWGPYFKQIMAEAMASSDSNDTATLRPAGGNFPQRISSVTITQSINSGYTAGSSTLAPPGSNADTSGAPGIFDPSRNINPARRPRALYLPHTTLTIQALLQFFYTSSLPPANSTLCTPQILCSLLQLARPYRIDGLLEAVVERLHHVLDNRNTAAIFNAAAMAAGQGDGVFFFNKGLEAASGETPPLNRANGDAPQQDDSDTEGLTASRLRSLRVDTDNIPQRPGTAMSGHSGAGSEDDASSAGPDGPLDGERTLSLGNNASGGERDVWTGSLSSVVGLQKRGLRGLMEGRRIREQSGGGVTGPASGSGGAAEASRVGLGIA